MVKINYELKMTEQLKNIENSEKKPKLLLHACCAPCSTMVIETLKNYFDISIFFYNPNITEKDEYILRLEEMKKYLCDIGENIKVIEGRYNVVEDFFAKVKGFENCKEGGERCYKCYSLRMGETAKFASENDFDYFTTVLSISPLKKANWINEIGEDLGKKYSINFLYGDFKKKGRYQEGIKISHKYNLYRQDYCGCIFSKMEAENYRKSKLEEKNNKNE